MDSNQEGFQHDAHNKLQNTNKHKPTTTQSTHTIPTGPTKDEYEINTPQLVLYRQSW